MPHSKQPDTVHVRLSFTSYICVGCIPQVYGYTNSLLPNSQYKKVKESCNRPGMAQRVPRDLGFQISMTFGT